MAEWLIERGIGEDRALLVDGDRALAAKMQWPGELVAGSVVSAKLVARASGSKRGTALADSGTEVLVDRLPPDVTEGSTCDVLITRARIAERGRLKRAQGRLYDRQAISPSPFTEGREVHRFPTGMWEDLWHNASSGEIAFPGGALLFSATPAMTLADIDGDLPPRELALAAIPALAEALPLFDLGGSIGIDFPTLAAKADRKAIDEALAQALAQWPHERTAINGFGFLHIVARLEGPSLLHRFATSRTGLAARYAMRVGERAEGTGAILALRVHPALKAKIKPEWLDELARRTGKQVRLETDPALALEAPQAQLLTS
ncbi:ribonuclease [Aurantiacibacter suaedae]|uniref:ribonuclease n=1 Tax=Aurantiacibacter suaedae TaxID=2545755 RepID=UPI0010F66455|nr:ribonuclease [Aurantiacibacter suaedae]